MECPTCPDRFTDLREFITHISFPHYRDKGAVVEELPR